MVDNKPSNMSSKPIRAENAGNQGNRQSADAGQGKEGTASSGVHSNFASASPESNVNPPGAPQTSHGSVSGAIAGDKDGVAGAQQQGADTTPPQVQTDKPSM